jgi:biopolymer transport protein ExbD
MANSLEVQGLEIRDQGSGTGDRRSSLTNQHTPPLDTESKLAVSSQAGNNSLADGVSLNMKSVGFPDQLLQTASAPIAGLFLVLTMVIGANPTPPARGVRVELLREGPSDCGDGRPVVIHWGPDGQVWLNEEGVGAQRAPQIVAEIMTSRAEKAVFLLPGKEASVQEVADLAARLHSAVDGLRIGVVTSRQRESITQVYNGMTYVPIGCMM